MPCRLCVERGKTWEGDNPRCAFETNTFDSDNWNCATMNTLRDIAEAHGMDDGMWPGPTFHTRHCDISLAVIPFADRGGFDRFLVLSCYKGRGRTGQAWIFCEDAPPVLLTLAFAEDCVSDWAKVELLVKP